MTGPSKAKVYNVRMSNTVCMDGTTGIKGRHPIEWVALFWGLMAIFIGLLMAYSLVVV